MVTYILLTTALAALIEFVALFVGHWLRVLVPEGVTLGLQMGVIAFFSTKLHQAFRE